MKLFQILWKDSISPSLVLLQPFVYSARITYPIESYGRCPTHTFTISVYYWLRMYSLLRVFKGGGHPYCCPRFWTFKHIQFTVIFLSLKHKLHQTNLTKQICRGKRVRAERERQTEKKAAQNISPKRRPGSKMKNVIRLNKDCQLKISHTSVF